MFYEIFSITRLQKSCIKPNPYAISKVKEAIALKNAIFADLFFTQECKNINKTYAANKKLQSCETGQLQTLAIRLNIRPKVKTAGKKCTNFNPFGKNL